MNYLSWFVVAGVLAAVSARAELVVKIENTQQTASKAVLKLSLRNTYKEKIESARAVAFLMDDQGKIVGQGAQWVIGGSQDKPALAPNATNTYHFVVPIQKPFTTSKITFSRILLEGGKTINPAQGATVEK